MARLIDVAKKAGVSVSTASKVLAAGKESDRISSACAERVRKAAAALDYRPNYHARSLLKGRSHTLGLVLADLDGGGLGGFWSRTIGGIADQTRAAGYDFLIVGPSQSEGELARGLRYLNEGRVDALIMPGFLYSVRSNDLLHEMSTGQPVVLAEYYGRTKLPVVGLDPEPGIRAAVKHLAGLGHREALWIGHIARGQEVAPERRKAFLKAADDEGLRAIEHFFTWDESISGRYSDAQFIAESRAMFSAWLAQRGPRACPTAVFAYNELMGLGLYAALRDAGLRVPQDVSVIGFDHIHAHLAIPTMTTVSLMLPQIGRRAADWALALATGAKKPRALAGMREHVAAELVVQESTAPPAQR